MTERYRVMAAPAGDPRGRHLVAAADLPAGACVLRETPYAFVLNSDAIDARCGCCLASPDPGQSLSRCSRCRADYYLSTDHQRRAWTSGHREECKCLSSAAQPGRLPPPAARLALRVALRAHADGDLKQDVLLSQSLSIPPDFKGFPGVISLLSHWDSAPDAVKLRHAQLGAWAWHALEAGCPDAAKETSPRDLAHLSARLSVNNHAICDAEQRPLGLGIYLLTAMANHSCQPTCAHTFGAKGAIELRTIRPVTAGEELTIAYVELAAPQWERRRALMAGHFFDIDAASSGDECSSNVVSVSDITGFTGKHVHHGGSVPPWPHDPRDLELSSLADPGQGIWGRVLDLNEDEDGADQLLGDLGRAFAGDAAVPPQTAAEGPNGHAPGVEMEVHTWAVDGDVDDLKDLAVRYAEALMALHDAKTRAAPPQKLAVRLKHSLDRLSASKCCVLSIGHRHVMRLRLLEALLKALVEEGGRWEEALQTARELLPLYEFVYSGDLWPPLALHLATLAKLEHLVGEPAVSAAVARRALAALEASAGPGGETRAEMERIWREAAAEARGNRADK